MAFAFMASGAMGAVNVDRIAPVDYVNPYIGNISHLLVPTFPTVHLPNSMLRVYPVRADFTTNYVSAMPLIVPDHRKGSVLNVVPYTGNLPEDITQVQLSYDYEEITPYSYKTFLDGIGVDVRMVPAHQSALYEFIINAQKPLSLSFVSEKGAIQVDGRAVTGFYEYQNETKSKVYFYAETDEAFETVQGTSTVKTIRFKESVPAVKMRYGVSLISVEQAKKNLRREIKDYAFDRLEEQGRCVWNEALGKLSVGEGGDATDKKIFYTALYRTFERPVNISEDGQHYSGFDGQVHSDEGRDFYLDDWYWDTFRATHPLRVMIDGQKESDILNSLVTMPDYMKEGEKWLPRFPKIIGDSYGMNCNHGIVSICDALYKGIKGIDVAKAFNASKAAVMDKTLIPWSGVKACSLDSFYYEKGFFPALNPEEEEYVDQVTESEHRQSVAVTLGTSYDHWALARIAKFMGNKEEEAFFTKHALNYRNLFNKETLFFHPKDSAGNFIPNVDYGFSRGRGARHYYDENNAYTYRWDVQHGIADLIDMMGGNEVFVRELDSLFTTSLGMGKFNFYKAFGADQSGNVGQFSMGNEPSFHIPYLYNYAGCPWKTQKMVNRLLNMWFRNDLMGIPGDEDGGGMSAFVVFSQLGFYPMTPGTPVYTIGTPRFPEMKVTMTSGKVLEVIAHNVSNANKYVQSVKINGKDWKTAWFTHDDIKNGGIIEFEMGPKPNYQWGNVAFKDTKYFEVE